jgi:hypothetical protein
MYLSATTLVLCLIAASLMILAGFDKHALQQKQARARCPSCGLDASDCSCR